MTEDTRTFIVNTEAAEDYYIGHPGEGWDDEPAEVHERDHTSADTRIGGAA